MKPFPQTCSVTLPPKVHPERPWWRKVKHATGYEGSAGPGWTRSDGLSLCDSAYFSPYHNEPCRHRSLYTGGKGHEIEFDELQSLTVNEILARIDVEHPLPEPRFQSGQVWLFEALQTTLVATLDIICWPSWHGRDLLAPFGRPLHSLPPNAQLDANPTACIGYSLLGRVLSQADGESLLRSQDPHWDAYLIFDPTNPHGNVYWTAAREPVTKEKPDGNG